MKSEGMVLEEGYLSNYFVTDGENMRVEFEEAWVYVTDKKLATSKDVQPILDVVKHRKEVPLIIAASSIECEALCLMILYKLNGMKICAIQSSSFGKNKEDLLMDLAIFTGATLVSARLGYTSQGAHEILFGRAKKVVIDKNRATFIGGYGDERLIEVRCEEIRAKLQGSLTDFEKEELQRRLTALTSVLPVQQVEMNKNSLLLVQQALMTAVSSREIVLTLDDQKKGGKDPPL